MTILKSALNYAYKADAIDSNAAWSREKFEPLPEENGVKVRFLTEEEAARLINASDAASGFRDLVRAALETGCRYGELARLRVRDFAVVKGCGILTIAMSKSGKGRSIDLTDGARDFFASLTVGRSPGDLLVPNKRLGREWRKSEQSRPMMTACEAAKIKPEIGFHILRHTWASNAVKNGMPMPFVAHVLGHASTVMTEKHYAHLQPSHIAETIRRFAPTYAVETSPTNVKKMRRK